MSTTPASSVSSEWEVITPAGPSRQPNHTNLHSLRPDIIIVGAGIAGTALSYSLSKFQNRKILLLERDLSEPDRIVGELLQPGGVAALTKLGMGDCLEGIDATPVEGYCVVSGSRQVSIPYPMMEKMVHEEFETMDNAQTLSGDSKGKGKSSGISEKKGLDSNGHTNAIPEWHVASKSGKKEGRSFHHGRLISSLRRKCLEAGPNLTVLEATVRELVYCEHTNRVIGISAAFKQYKRPSPNDSEEVEPTTIVRKVYAPIVIIADGCFSKFRNLPGMRIPSPQTRSHFVGIVIKDAELPDKYHGTVCLTPEGPVLLYQIGNKAEETRMLVDVKGKLPSVADGSLKNHIATKYLPHLPTTLHLPIQKALDSQRLRTMPNSFLPPSMQGHQQSPYGLIMVGDAWNMRHPLTGGGMTVAFNDAVLLNQYLGIERLGEGRGGLEDWERVSEGLREWFWRRKGLAGTINVLSMALYDLFGGAEEPDLEILREGCFRYFELGGECISGPVGLLSALTPKPFILFYHFFSVAFYSIYILLRYGPPPDSAAASKFGSSGGSSMDQKSSAPGWLQMPGLMIFSVRVFWTACVVLLPMIFTEFKI